MVIKLNLNSQLNILCFFDSFYPGTKSGGPIISSLGFAEWMSDIFSISIYTRNKDYGEKKAYSTIICNKWNNNGKYKVFYSTYSSLLFQLLFQVKKRKYEIYYVNSVFSFFYSILPIVLIKLNVIPNKSIVLAPRGELAENALAIKKWKKSIYLFIFKKIIKNMSVRFQATSEHEKNDIIRTFGSFKNIYIAGNLRPKSDVPKYEPSCKTENRLNICSVSRISKIKNIEFAINIVNEMSSSTAFHIYGNIEDSAYYNYLNRTIKNSNIRFMGPIKTADVISTIQKYDLFFLPTKGENFGHSILEAFMSSRPVLISDKTPWRNLTDSNAGFDISLDAVDEFRKVILDIFYMDKNQHENLCRNAYSKFKLYNDSISIDNYITLFNTN